MSLDRATEDDGDRHRDADAGVAGIDRDELEGLPPLRLPLVERTRRSFARRGSLAPDGPRSIRSDDSSLAPGTLTPLGIESLSHLPYPRMARHESEAYVRAGCSAPHLTEESTMTTRGESPSMPPARSPSRSGTTWRTSGPSWPGSGRRRA
jgi:hypothetical protein